MTLARTAAHALLQRRSARLAALLVTALAIGATAALMSAPGGSSSGVGANASDVTGPAAASAWG